jgi:hypothetical protein
VLAGVAGPVLMTVALAVCVPWLLRGPLDPRQEALPVSASFQAAAVELHRVVPPMGRHLLVTPPATAQIGTDNPSRWLAVASGTSSAHLYFWEATRENTDGILAADLLWTIDPAAALDTLRRAGVTHVVTADPAQAAALDEVDGFRPVWTGFDVTIHEVVAAPGRPSPEALLQPAAEEPLAFRLTAGAVERDPEHLAWDAEADTDLAVVAAVNYDPAWRATVDGRPVEVHRSREGFAELDLPAGRHHVDLRFTATHPDHFGLPLTVAALAALAVALRRRRTAL